MRLFMVFFIIFICNQGSVTTSQCDTNASCGCSTLFTPSARIIGGETALQGSWPWAISLRYYGAHICGGSILSPYFIITTAHCIDDITDPASLTILAGSLTLNVSSSSEPYQILSITQIIKHIYYDSNTLSNDIAVLRLASPINITKGNSKPICLPTNDSVQPTDNISMVVVGWGVTSMLSTTLSSNLIQVTVQSIASTSSDCQSVIYNSTLQFCAGISTGGKDACLGDSGGPLMASVNGFWQLYGLTSYGYGCALAGNPGVYTRISYYVSWIKSNIQIPETTATTITKELTTTTTNETNHATERNHFTESVSQMSNIAKRSIVHCYNFFINHNQCLFNFAVISSLVILFL